ncbi:MAG: hypothetical protein ABF289_20195 [Clostridiales bacterium]
MLTIKKSIISILLLVLTILVIGINAFAASNWNVILPDDKGNTDLASNKKDAEYNNTAYAALDSMGGSYTKMNVWVRTGVNGTGKQVSGVFIIYEGQGYVSAPISGVSNGTYTYLRGENYKDTYVTVSAQGRYFN